MWPLSRPLAVFPDCSSALSWLAVHALDTKTPHDPRHPEPWEL